MISAINQAANLLHPPASRYATTLKKNAEVAGCVEGEEVLVTNGRARGVSFPRVGVSPSKTSRGHLFLEKPLQKTFFSLPIFFSPFSMLMFDAAFERTKEYIHVLSPQRNYLRGAIN